MLIEDNRLYTLIVLIAAALSIILAMYAWSRRSSPGALPLSGALLATSSWILAGGLSGTSSNHEISLFWYKFVYISLAVIPVLFFIMVIDYSGREKWITRKRISLLFIIPLISIIILWIFPGLFFNVTMKREGSLWIRGAINPGIWFFIHSIYNYILLFTGLVLLINQARRTHNKYRRQVIFILVSFFPPVVSSIFATLEIIPASLMVLSLPVSFMVTGISISYALFKYKFLNLLPIARTILVDTMVDAMIVFNENDEVVDLNPAASKLLGLSPLDAIGNSIFSLTGKWPDLTERLRDFSTSKTQIKLEAGDDTIHFLVQVAPISDERKRTRGNMVILGDVSSLAVANERLVNQMAEINTLQMELREQAIHDPLTNLFNRRYLNETLERELARAIREVYPVSFIMLDIDHFKHVNDRYGHQAGDLVLTFIGKILRAHSRAGDIACRYGGEEFLVVLPNTSVENAVQITEHWRLIFHDASVAWEDIQIRTTFSMGVAAFPKHGNNAIEVIAAADNAVYKAKANGGNQVVVWEGT